MNLRFLDDASNEIQTFYIFFFGNDSNLLLALLGLSLRL